MKILFSKKGSYARLVDEDRLIFCVDYRYFDASGNEVPSEPRFCKENTEDDDDETWYQDWMKNEGLEQPLKAVSTIDIDWEIDDGFGCFGFQNEAGEFVIEPQYAYAHEFTQGLASVNLNRTWYKSEEGKRFYENHYGYINERGQTIIGFQFDEAAPFNKYGVAVVTDIIRGTWLIDTEGNEIPGTRFPYLSDGHEYDERFLEFSYDLASEAPVGIYDTKERKILLEPSIDSIIEYSEDLILVYERNGPFGYSDFRQYFINSKGEILYPWLYQKGFAITRKPDANRVAAVAISEYTELQGKPICYFPHDGKKYERKFIYGLYSSKEEFLLPLEYDEIRNLGNNLWGCHKDGVVTIVRTEEGD